MNSDLKISLDLMGGDNGPQAVIPAAINILQKDSSIKLTLVGLPEAIEQAKSCFGEKYKEKISYIEASEVVSMQDDPIEALRRKKKSSLRLAIEEVKYNRVDACVSSGNTGALMATAKYLLGMIPGVDRPAIVSAIPSIKGTVFMLDLGANINSTPSNLFQFAVMGSIISKGISGINKPRVALLNVGEEEIKGNDLVKDTAKLLSNSNLNYVGFIEGNDIFNNNADVVVTDGFVGNISLKSMEGVANLISYYIKKKFSLSFYRKLQFFLAKPSMNEIRKKLDSRQYNGATLVGLNGIVVKSHGHSDSLAFESAVNIAIIEARKNLPSEIKEFIDKL